MENKEVITVNRTKKLTFCALFAALIFVATFFIRIPIAIGYLNAGDGLIILTGAFLGGIPGAIAGALGSALADLISGYVVYAPVTALIKGLMGFLAGVFLYKKERKILRTATVSLLCGLIMVTGYFVFECIIYTPAAAILSVVPNIAQALFGIAIAVLGSKLKLFK